MTMRNALETLGGLHELLRLALKSGCRLRGKYWRWRYETAFGSNPNHFTTRRQRLRSMIEYGKWVYRMKRGGR